MEEAKYRVRVLLKEGVLDVQGKAIESSLPELGVSNISNVRVGKLIEFSMSRDSSGADDEEQAAVRRVCEELFSNPVIESYQVEEIS